MGFPCCDGNSVEWNASAHCCNRSSEARKTKQKTMIFFSFSCQSDWTDWLTWLACSTNFPTPGFQSSSVIHLIWPSVCKGIIHPAADVCIGMVLQNNMVSVPGLKIEALLSFKAKASPSTSWQKSSNPTNPKGQLIIKGLILLFHNKKFGNPINLKGQLSNESLRNWKKDFEVFEISYEMALLEQMLDCNKLHFFFSFLTSCSYVQLE